MSSTEQTYRDAAKEHLNRAFDRSDAGAYFLSHYLSGLAVECHLRAYLRRKTSEFDSRHDVQLLVKESGFYEIVPKQQTRFAAIFATINLRWRSNHRYYSERQLLDYLNDVRAEFNVRGDRWKNLARALLNGASAVIAQGEAKW
jgi:HEPN domain-containing protein